MHSEFYLYHQNWYALVYRNQRIKINKNFSDRNDIEFGVPQGSVLGLLLFNTDMIVLFHKCKDSTVTSCTDVTTPY